MNQPRLCGGKMPVLAQMDTVLAGLIGSLVTSIITGAGLWGYRILKLRGEQSQRDKAKSREDERIDNEHLLKEHQRILVEVRSDLDLVKKELRDEQRAHRRTQNEHATCRERIARLESWYQASTGRDLPPLTGMYTPLPPSGSIPPTPLPPGRPSREEDADDTGLDS